MANMLKKINALILRKDSCVLATTDGETPHCSLMAYIPDESGERLYLVTSNASRKYQNIRRHPRVSLLIDTRGEQQRKLTQAVTVTGTCDILQDTVKIAQIKADYRHYTISAIFKDYIMTIRSVSQLSSSYRYYQILGKVERCDIF
jgi:nitroimidazol reductase NimA-like FMN-containing flavoprotein (pyridoxamine 5'-phosphate oxidase superfamily)